MSDTRADAPVASTELTIADAGNALANDFHDDHGTAESAPPPSREVKEADAPELTDDTRVALKDGSEVSIRELKRGYISRKTFTQKTQALAQERTRLEDLRALTQQHSTQLAQSRLALENVAAVLLPQPPDPSIVDVDPQLWKQQQQNYQLVMAVIGDAQQTAQAELQAAQAARHAEMQDFGHRVAVARQEQKEKLLEAMPELRDANGVRRFVEDATATMAQYGYSFEELDASLASDVRNYRTIRDLIALRKARSVVPKVKDKAASVPVLTGKRRMDRNERSERTARNGFEQLRNSGRLDDAAALLARRMQE